MDQKSLQQIKTLSQKHICALIWLRQTSSGLKGRKLKHSVFSYSRMINNTSIRTRQEVKLIIVELSGSSN